MSALESLLFAKYQMYRNVYWHHAVRSATCMFKRAVREAVRRGNVTAESDRRGDRRWADGAAHHPRPRSAGRRIRARRLHKRALDLPASDVPGERAALGGGRSAICWSGWRMRWPIRVGLPAG